MQLKVESRCRETSWEPLSDRVFLSFNCRHISTSVPKSCQKRLGASEAESASDMLQEVAVSFLEHRKHTCLHLFLADSASDADCQLPGASEARVCI